MFNKSFKYNVWKDRESERDKGTDREKEREFNQLSIAGKKKEIARRRNKIFSLLP